jgi:predicted GIY-YIG superfamily endonuclease
MDDASVLSTFIADVEDGTEDEEDSDGGWFDNVVESGGNLVGVAKEGTVNGAGAVWNVAEQAPGAVWDVAEQAPGAVWDVAEQTPGAIGGAITGTWQSLREFFSNSVELRGWTEFLDDYPLLGIILGPLILIIIGLSPDGTISYLEIGLGLFALLIPAVKGGQALWRGMETLLPWASDAENAFTTVRHNPAGIVTGVMDTVRYARARIITPHADDFATLPKSSGVYEVRDAAGTPIYVGMSNSLHRRVLQHFVPPQSAFAPRTDTIKVMQTDSVTDARALECRLIKQFDPQFNVIFRGPGACPIYTEALVPLAP